MRVMIAAVGRMKAGPERDLMARYLDRARAGGKALGMADFSVLEIPESRAASADVRKAEEARAIAAALPERAAIVALDERGQSLSSDRFAQWVSKQREIGQSALCFLIGGADGLDPDLRERAELVLSFSPMTWPHQLARMMLAEQLYRATTILVGHPYHRGQ